MINFLSSLSFILVLLFSIFGVGQLAAHFLYQNEKLDWAFVSTLGVAIWITYGGILNVLHFAYPTTLKISLVLGFSLGIYFFFLQFKQWRQTDAGLQPELIVSGSWHTLGSMRPNLLYRVFLAATLMFLVLNLMPTGAFNLHDDFHTYLDRPVQMLQNGTILPNPFTPLGLDSLGAQAFMQSFFCLYFDFKYVNGFDAIICFILILALIIELGKKIGSRLGHIVLAVMLVVFINPQYVNISSLYSGTLMILGLILSSMYLKETLTNKQNVTFKGIMGAAIPVALFYSAAVALKTTYVIFLCFFFLLNLFYDLWNHSQKKRVLSAHLAIVAQAILLLIPWLALSRANYREAITLFMGSKGSTVPSGQAANIAPLEPFKTFFSTADLFWGNTYFDYLLAIAVLAMVFCAITLIYLRGDNRFQIPLISPMLSAAGATFFCYFAMGLIFPCSSVIRYTAPIIIAVLPVTALLGSCYQRQRQIVRQNNNAPPPPAVITQGLPLIFALLLMLTGTFLSTFFDRLQRINANQHLLSFPVYKNYLDFMQFALSKDREEHLRSAQETTEKGETILAWISTPFQLDFNRNRIYSVKSFSTPWLNIPLGADNERLWQYLRAQGIRYIMWESSGFAVKSLQYHENSKNRSLQIKESELSIYLVAAFQNFKKQTKMVYQHNSLIIFDIQNFLTD